MWLYVYRRDNADDSAHFGLANPRFIQHHLPTLGAGWSNSPGPWIALVLSFIGLPLPSGRYDNGRRVFFA